MMIFKNEIGDHLGDSLVFVSAGLALSDRMGEPVGMSRKYNRNGALTPTMIEEIAAILDSPGSVVPSDEPGTESFGNLWKGGILGNGLQLLPTKKRWKGPQGKMYSFQFDGRTSPAKNPHTKDEPKLLAACPKGLMPIRLGWPLTIAQSLDILCECDFFVGCDSGIAMLAIAAGVPTYIVQFGMPVDHWKIGLTYTKCLGVEGFRAAIKLWPEIPHTKVDHVYYPRPVDESEHDKLMSIHPPGINENLIYYVVQGEEYRDMLAWSVRSVREFGKYLGKILILTQKICPKLQALGKEADLLEIDFKYPRAMDNCSALPWIHGHRFRSVMYLDCDILAMNDVNPLLHGAHLPTFMEEPWQTYADKLEDPIYTFYFSKDELNRLKRMKPINSGQWVIPGARCADLHQLWQTQYEARKDRETHGAEQSALNAVLRRNRLRWKPFGPQDVANATIVPEIDWQRFILLHFAGDQDRLQRMPRALQSRVEAAHAVN